MHMIWLVTAPTRTTGIVSIASENWKVSDREKANTGLPLAGGVFGMISTVEMSCSTTAACAVKTPTATANSGRMKELSGKLDKMREIREKIEEQARKLDKSFY